MLLDKLHPQDVLDHTFSNHITTHHLSDMVAVKQKKGHMLGGGVTKVAIFFTTPSIPDVELLAVIKIMKVLTNCDPSKVFASSTQSPAAVPTALPNINGANLEDFYSMNISMMISHRSLEWDSLLMMILSWLKKICLKQAITSCWTLLLAFIMDRSGTGVVIVNELLPHQPSKLPHYMGVETQ